MKLGREKICDICGNPFWRGIKVKGIRQKGLLICDKCEQTAKLLIVGRRKVWKKFAAETND